MRDRLVKKYSYHLSVYLLRRFKKDDINDAEMFSIFAAILGVLLDESSDPEWLRENMLQFLILLKKNPAIREGNDD